MNSRHSRVTDWGLSRISIAKEDTILDVGCGGGRTVSKLAAIATQGKIYGLDYSQASVAVAIRTNRQWIDMGRVEIREGCVSQMPFTDDMFDLVTAVETHFWWPNLPADMREVLRVLKPGGRLIIVAEIYKGAKTKTAKLAEKYLPMSGMKLLSVNEHRDLFANGGYSDVQIIEESSKGWICGIGSKPPTRDGFVHDDGRSDPDQGRRSNPEAPLGAKSPSGTPRCFGRMTTKKQ
jgi:ubiquinone/menaquinone biosynthesis C-methylase UbiE